MLDGEDSILKAPCACQPPTSAHLLTLALSEEPGEHWARWAGSARAAGHGQAHPGAAQGQKLPQSQEVFPCVTLVPDHAALTLWRGSKRRSLEDPARSLPQL